MSIEFIVDFQHFERPNLHLRLFPINTENSVKKLLPKSSIISNVNLHKTPAVEWFVDAFTLESDKTILITELTDDCNVSSFTVAFLCGYELCTTTAAHH